MRDTGLLHPALLLYYIRLAIAIKKALFPVKIRLKPPPCILILYTLSVQSTRKPAVYIIDGLNFVRSYLNRQGADEEALTSELVFWLDDLSRGTLAGSDFRLILDGSFRNLGQRNAQNVYVKFTEDITADEVIFEQALYLHETNNRVIVVSSDLELTSKLRTRGIKTLGCSKFFNDFYI